MELTRIAILPKKQTQTHNTLCNVELTFDDIIIIKNAKLIKNKFKDGYILMLPADKVGRNKYFGRVVIKSRDFYEKILDKVVKAYEELQKQNETIEEEVKHEEETAKEEEKKKTRRKKNEIDNSENIS